MGEPTEFEDWELLHSSDGDSTSGEEIDAESYDSRTIKPDYFTICSAAKSDSELGGLVIAGNPSLVDPNSASRCLNRPSGELGSAGIGVSSEDSDAFWSDELPEDRSSLLGSEIGEKGEIFCGKDSLTEDGSEGVVDRIQISDEGGALNNAGSGETEEIEGNEAIDEKTSDLVSVESGGREDRTGLSAGVCDGDVTLGNPLPCEGENSEKRGTLWLKLPLDLVKFCLLRVRPVWSISIAATFLGILVLGRRLYKMKRKSRSMALKLRIEDKKTSLFVVRAPRFNEAIPVARGLPIFPPTTGVTLWPAVGFL